MLGCLLAVGSGLGAEPELVVEEGAGLEASMHSSFLQAFQAFQAGPEGSRTENPARPGSPPEPWAVVGRLFQLKVPRQDLQLGHVVKVRSRDPDVHAYEHRAAVAAAPSCMKP